MATIIRITLGREEEWKKGGKENGRREGRGSSKEGDKKRGERDNREGERNKTHSKYLTMQNSSLRKSSVIIYKILRGLVDLWFKERG